MADRIMSDTEIKRRKKLQGHISQATGALGLTALGGSLLATKNGGNLTQGAFRAIGRERPAALKPKKLSQHTAPVLATSAGIGGAGSFNFASYTNAESRKRKMATPVKKEYGMDMGYFGEEGHPLTHEEIEAEIEKAWTPSASNFDSERSRHRRNDVYQGGAIAAGGAGGAYAAKHTAKAVKHRGSLKPKVMSEVQHRVNSAGQSYKIALGSAGEKAIPLKGLKHAGKAGLGLAAVGGAAATHSAIKRKKNSGWQSYAKRNTTSAFGVDHSDNPNGQHRETDQ